MQSQIIRLEIIPGSSGRDFELFAEKVAFTTVEGFGLVQGPPHRTVLSLEGDPAQQVNAVIDHAITTLGATQSREDMKATALAAMQAGG